MAPLRVSPAAVAVSVVSTKNTTNNQMELMAAIEALKKIPIGEEVQIYTDSKYLKLGITEWIHNWKKNGWKTSNSQ